MPTLIPPNDEQLLTFFKALADTNRLKIVGLLSQHPYSVEQLAALLDLRPPTISHHLKLLSEAGLVTARAESYYNLYQLESTVLEQMVKTSRAVHLLAERLGVEMPLVAALYKILYENLAPKEAIKKLMARELKDEIEAMTETW